MKGGASGGAQSAPLSPVWPGAEVGCLGAWPRSQAGRRQKLGQTWGPGEESSRRAACGRVMAELGGVAGAELDPLGHLPSSSKCSLSAPAVPALAGACSSRGQIQRWRAEEMQRARFCASRGCSLGPYIRGPLGVLGTPQNTGFFPGMEGVCREQKEPLTKLNHHVSGVFSAVAE